MSHEFAFDVTLTAAFRVNAETEDEAREMLKEHLDSADSNFGAWPDGSPILAEASLGHILDLYEIDNEPPARTSRTPIDEYRRVARKENATDECEFDDTPAVSMGEDAGAFVQAWIWVERDDTNICCRCLTVDPTVTNGEGFDGMCAMCADETETEAIE